jgi:superfamily II DNA or RNA helicase
MSRSVRLRPWQHAALQRFIDSPKPDFLAVATPGAGKTTFALTALRTVLATHPARVVIVAPTAHLKVQWASAAAALGLHVDPAWSPTEGAMPADMHGIVTTYQQVAMSPEAVRDVARGAIVVLDEVHHAGEEQAWGESLRTAFGGAARRLSLSGTPFRSDTRAIPFIRYDLDEAVPDFEYGYDDALRDGRVVRPIYFPRLGGAMEWSASDGSIQSATFDDPLTSNLANQRLRTALSLEGDWLTAVLADAVARLAEVRTVHADAGGLVIATDQEHARGIATVLRERFATTAVVVTSDDPGSSARIAAFAGSDTEWLVAVRMVSEGVDIPRLRVGVFATTTTTDLFFRQAVGRFVRWMPRIRDQRSWLFIPDDPRLRARAAEIAEQRRHSLRKPARPDGDEPAQNGELPGADEEQLSMFAPLSAVALAVPVPDPDSADWRPWHEPLPDDAATGPDLTIEFELAPPPPLAGLGGDAAGAGGLTRRQRKDQLRLANADAARHIARATDLTHAQVNLELNRLAGMRRIDEATVEQLQARLEHATRWRWRLAR